MTTPQGTYLSAGYPAEPGVDTKTVLTDLLETLVDGIRGYLALADKLENLAAAISMRERAESRRAAAEAIVRTAADHGVTTAVDLEGTLTGGLHRAWIALEGVVAGDQALIESAITGEQHALDACDQALAGLDEPIAASVRIAADDIRSALSELEQLTNAG